MWLSRRKQGNAATRTVTNACVLSSSPAPSPSFLLKKTFQVRPCMHACASYVSSCSRPTGECGPRYDNRLKGESLLSPAEGRRERNSRGLQLQRASVLVRTESPATPDGFCANDWLPVAEIFWFSTSFWLHPHVGGVSSRAPSLWQGLGSRTTEMERQTRKTRKTEHRCFSSKQLPSQKQGSVPLWKRNLEKSEAFAACSMRVPTRGGNTRWRQRWHLMQQLARKR